MWGFCLLAFNGPSPVVNKVCLKWRLRCWLVSWSKAQWVCQYKHFIALNLNLVIKERLQISPEHEPSIRTPSGIQLKKHTLMVLNLVRDICPFQVWYINFDHAHGNFMGDLNVSEVTWNYSWFLPSTLL